MQEQKIDRQCNKSWTEYFRVITPFLLLILTWLSSSITARIDKMDNKIDSLDNKIYHHMTNDEIHTPKDIVITRPEFLIYQELRSKEMNTLKDMLIDNDKRNVAGINKIYDILEKHREYTELAK